MLGELIGNYRIVGELGSGGMGEVYLAEHERIHTRIAVKVLFPNISKQKSQVERFFNEARAVAQIQHAGTVKIHDVGFTASKQAYLLMELLDGESLAARIERGRLPHGAVCEIARQIASVLAATHDAGIIHRDLKPDNVFLVRDKELPGGERVKVLDFGIAKLTGLLAPKRATLSQSTMGTPMYMSPEQAGDASKVDGRADIYSLGCMVFEMACGQLPFEATTALEALAKHMREAPPPCRSIVPDVSPALDALVARMLAKSPDDRPQTMHELIAAFADLGASGGGGGHSPVRSAMATPTLRPTASPAGSPHETTLRGPQAAASGVAGPRPKTPLMVKDTFADGDGAVTPSSARAVSPAAAWADVEEATEVVAADFDPVAPPAVVPAGSQPPVSEPEPPAADASPAAEEEGRPARLVVVSPNFAGTEFALTGTLTTIGRAADNDIVLDDRSITPQHAQIVREPSGRTSITSTRGGRVRINGVERARGELRRGDAIDLGAVRLRFVDAGQSFLFVRDAGTEMPGRRRKRWPRVLVIAGGVATVILAVVIASRRGGATRVQKVTALDGGVDRTPIVVAPLAIDAGSVPTLTPRTLQELVNEVNRFVPAAGESFAIQRKQVSRAEYGRFLDGLPADERERNRPLDDRGLAGDADQPVAFVAFEQASAFCRALDAKLPTVEQWKALHDARNGADARGPLRDWTSSPDPNGKGSDLVIVLQPDSRELLKTTNRASSQRAEEALGFRCARPHP